MLGSELPVRSKHHSHIRGRSRVKELDRGPSLLSVETKTARVRVGECMCIYALYGNTD